MFTFTFVICTCLHFKYFFNIYNLQFTSRVADHLLPSILLAAVVVSDDHRHLLFGHCCMYE